jgi:hypothetical protein
MYIYFQSYTLKLKDWHQASLIVPSIQIPPEQDIPCDTKARLALAPRPSASTIAGLPHAAVVIHSGAAQAARLSAIASCRLPPSSPAARSEAVSPPTNPQGPTLGILAGAVLGQAACHQACLLGNRICHLHHLATASTPRPTNEVWTQADFCVRGWMYSTVSDAVLNLAMTDNTQTASAIWTAIGGVFQANKAPRAIFLNHEFHSLTQGTCPSTPTAFT